MRSARLALPSLLLALSFTPALAASMFTRLPDAAGRTFGLVPTPAGAVRSVQRMAVDEGAMHAFRDAGGGSLELPALDGSTVTLELQPMELFADGFGPTYTDDHGRHPFTSDVSLFKGRVAGEPDSWAVLSMGPEGVLGTVQRAGVRWSLMPATFRRAGEPLPEHALAADD